MTPLLRDLVPPDFDAWAKETMTLLGRTVCTARKAGVTLHLVCEDGWWTVTKMHKGQVLARKVVKKLPSDVRAAVDAGRMRRTA